FAAALEYPAGTLVVAVITLLAMSNLWRAALLTLPAALVPLALSHALDFAVFGEPLFFFTRSNDWFHYAGSYWTSPAGLDEGRPSAALYAAHFLVGHHGAFLLMPLFAAALGSSLACLLGGSTQRRAAAVLLALLLPVLVTILMSQVDGWYRESLGPLVLLPLVPLLLPAPARSPRASDIVAARLV